jgi:hypothetical protein
LLPEQANDNFPVLSILSMEAMKSPCCRVDVAEKWHVKSCDLSLYRRVAPRR